MAITFITSIPASLILYDDILNQTDFILGSGDQTRVEVGAFLEVLQAIAQIGVAVVIFPILRRKHERMASATSHPGPSNRSWSSSAPWLCSRSSR